VQPLSNHLGHLLEVGTISVVSIAPFGSHELMCDPRKAVVEELLENN